MANQEVKTEHYDAFISYSRKDIDFARKLEAALEAYKPPRDFEAPQRYLNIFRDEGDLTGVEYFQSIERQIQSSAKLIVICSPAARQSQYVNDEIRRFAQAKGAENIIPLMVAGIPNNEAKAEQAADMAFPEALVALGMPLAESYLGFDPHRDKVDRGLFNNPWYTLLANLYNLSRNEIEQRDLKRRVHRRNIAITIISIVMGVLAGITIYALWQKAIAEDRRIAAVSRQLEAQSLLKPDQEYELSLLLSVEADRMYPSIETRSHLFAMLDWKRQLSQVLHGHEKKVIGIAFWPDGQNVISADESGRIIIQNLKNTAPPRMLEVGQPVSSIALSPKKDLLALATGNAIQLWDPKKGERLNPVLKGHQKAVTSLAFAPPDGRFLASGSWDGTAILWDVAPRKPLGEPLKGHRGSEEARSLSLAYGVKAVAWSPDGTKLATSGGDNKVILWDAQKMEPIGAPLEGHLTHAKQLFPGVEAIAFSPDGQLLASGGLDYQIILWDVNTHQQLGDPFRAHQGGVTALTFDAAGLLYSASQDGTVRVWNIKDRRPVGGPLQGHRGYVTALAPESAGDGLLSGGNDDRVILWKPSAWHHRLARTLLHPSPGTRPTRPAGSSRRHFPDLVKKVAYSSSGKILASGGDDGVVVIWDAKTGGEIDRFQAQPQGVFALAFSPDEKFIACGGISNAILIHQIGNSLPGVFLSGHGGAVDSLDFSPEGKVLAARSTDGGIKFWDLEQATPIGEPIPQGKNLVGLVAFLDGEKLLSAESGGKIILWDVKQRKILRESEPLPAEGKIAINRQGGLLACDVAEGTILWDIRRWRKVGPRFSGKPQGISSSGVALNADGKLLAVSEGNYIILKDAGTGEPVLPPLPTRGSTNDIAFQPDGKTLAVVGASPHVFLWDINFESWKQTACITAGRGLTQKEWDFYLPGEPSHKSCPDLAKGSNGP